MMHQDRIGRLLAKSAGRVGQSVRSCSIVQGSKSLWLFSARPDVILQQDATQTPDTALCVAW
jgi:hypothetical protein